MPQYRVAGVDMACRLCQGAEFFERKVKLNTGAMSFFNLDWLNKAGEGLVCTACGYIHIFYSKDSIEQIS